MASSTSSEEENYARKLVHPDRGGTLGRAVYQIQSRMWHIRSFAEESPIFTECNRRLLADGHEENNRPNKEDPADESMIRSR